MNEFERKFEVDAESDERELEATLGHFRAAVKGWSEQEYARPSGVKSRSVIPWWVSLTRPVTAGALAAGIAVATIGVPVLYQHETRVRLQKEAGALPVQEARASEQQGTLVASVAPAQNPAAGRARGSASAAVDDDELLRHVDSDVSQSAPDALEPLASLMSETP